MKFFILLLPFYFFTSTANAEGVRMLDCGALPDSSTTLRVSAQVKGSAIDQPVQNIKLKFVNIVRKVIRSSLTPSSNNLSLSSIVFEGAAYDRSYAVQGDGFCQEYRFYTQSQTMNDPNAFLIKAYLVGKNCDVSRSEFSIELGCQIRAKSRSNVDY